MQQDKQSTTVTMLLCTTPQRWFWEREKVRGVSLNEPVEELVSLTMCVRDNEQHDSDTVMPVNWSPTDQKSVGREKEDGTRRDCKDVMDCSNLCQNLC